MRWLSRLLVAFVVCLLAIGLPAAPAQANGASITLSPTSGIPGEEAKIRGYNFTANEWVDIYYDGDFIDEIETDNDGDFPWVTFTIPESCTGAHKVRAEVSSTVYVETDFTVKPGLTVSSQDGPVGTNVTVEGHGFAEEEENIELLYYPDGTALTVGQTISADEDGWWKRSFLIPASSTGNHKIDAQGDDSSSAKVGDAYFEVKPGLTIDELSGSPGQNITMTGGGFAVGERDIRILFDGEEAQAEIIRADENGYWRESFEVPERPMGTYSVTAEGEWTHEEDIDALDFEIIPGLILSPGGGHVGTELTVTGGGFATDKSVVIKYDGGQKATTSTDSQGSFEVGFTVPESQHGQRTVTAEAAGNNATAIFTMESNPPGTPEPISPDGGRAGFIGGVRPTFEWSEVSDDSGVRYNLQISIGANVTATGFANPTASITDITGTNYTLQKNEALPYGTYYWIVRAVDRAGNAGNWSEAYSFHAGILPLWAFILIIVAAVALIGTLVYFFIIRKRIYYY